MSAGASAGASGRASIGWRAVLPSEGRGVACLAAAILVACAADFFFFTGFFASDDGAYLFGSRQLAEGGPLVASQWSLRLGITLPDAAIYWLGGGDIAWVCWFHVLYHLGLVLIAFHLGRRVADERVGIVAAWLAAVQPLLYVYAGAVLPDNAMSLWIGLLVIVLDAARRRDLASPGAGRRWYVAAGLLIGAAYSCKETALIMVVPAAICVMAAAPRLRSMQWIRNGTWMAAGLLAFVAIESIALWVFTGEPQWRLGYVSAAGDVFDQKMATQGTAPWERFAYAGRVLSAIAPLSLWVLVAAAAVHAFTARRNLMLLAFFWWPALYLTLGSTSFTHYYPPTMQPRYYAVALLPALVILAMGLVWLHDRWGASTRIQPILRGRVRVAALALVIGGVVVYEVATNAPRASNIYLAPFSRGYAAALEIVRDEHAGYTVLPEPFYASRMRPLLFPQAPEWLSEGMSLARRPPAPPFIYLERVAEAEKRRKRSGAELASAPGKLRFRTVRTYYPPRARWDVVRDGLGRLFAVQPRDPVPPALRRGGVAIQLVTWDRPPAAVPPLFSLRGDAAVQVIEDGVHHVSWGGSAGSSAAPADEPPRFYVQTSDRRSFRTPPDGAESRFASPADELTVHCTYRLVEGDTVRLKIALYGYDASGKLAENRTELTLTSRQDTVTAKLSLSSPGLVSYKIRTRVIASRQHGALQVFPPIVQPPAP